MLPELSLEEIYRYSRHLLIPEIGLEGQKKIKTASVLVVGTGGLGSPISLYLAAAGVGRIGLVDYDILDKSNLQRQIVHTENRLGYRKVESARDRLLDLNNDIQVDIFSDIINSENAVKIAKPYDIIVDGSDNIPTRYLLNDLSVLTDKPFVYGAVYRFDGQASTFSAKNGPCYRCLFPDPPPPNLVPSCAEGGVLGVLPGTIGSIQATETLKLILEIGEPLIGKLLLYDALDLSFQVVRLQKNSACRICGENPEISNLIDYEAFCGVSTLEDKEGSAGEEWDITPQELAAEIEDGNALRLIDVREPHEQAISNLEGSELIPLGQFASRLSDLNSAEDIVLFCKTGTRSARALEILASAGFKKIKNLKGGINAWAVSVDPSLPIY